MSNPNIIDEETLLSDKRVVAEIHRHLWIESEKVGYNIGFEKAREEWLENFSKAWMGYHMPEHLLRSKKSSPRIPTKRKTSTRKTTKPKKRRAKSYLT